MKQIFTILAVLVSAITFGQTAAEFLKTRSEKDNVKDFEGVIIGYSNAINADKNVRDGYFNGGVCEPGLKDLRLSMKDFDQAIEPDPKFVQAHYKRAFVFVSLFGNEQQTGESLLLEWPPGENWKVGDDQENDQQHVIDMIHSNETIDKWTELGNMTTIKGVKGLPVDKAMNLMFEQSQQSAPKAVLTFIEKDEKAEFPWIIFTIESPNFKNDKTPESQLWYVIQGKQALYTNFRAVKKATLPAELKEKWIRFFKTAKIINKQA